MIYIKWIFMLPVMLFVTAATFPLAFVLPLFVEFKEGLLDNATKTGMGWRLPDWLGWFQTVDNSIDGDQGWRENHMQWRFRFPSHIATYLGRIGWLWRNPGYGVGCEVMTGNPIEATFTGNEKVNDSPLSEGYILVKSQNLFQFTWCKKITETKCLYFVFGWNIKGLIGSKQKTHIATYAFSPRVSTFKL